MNSGKQKHTKVTNSRDFNPKGQVFLGNSILISLQPPIFFYLNWRTGSQYVQVNCCCLFSVPPSRAFFPSTLNPFPACIHEPLVGTRGKVIPDLIRPIWGKLSQVEPKYFRSPLFPPFFLLKLYWLCFALGPWELRCAQVFCCFVTKREPHLNIKTYLLG